jgi:hypothetical protein
MKKKFGVIDSMLGDTEENQNETVETSTEAAAPTQQRGKGRPKEDEYEARSFRVKKEHFAKIKIIAAREGLMLKDILDYALESIIDGYEKKKGEKIDISQATEQKTNLKEIF